MVALTEGHWTTAACAGITSEAVTASGAAAPARTSPIASVDIPVGRYLDPVAAAALARDGYPSRSQEPPPAPGDDDPGLLFQEVARESGISFRYTFGDYAYDNILESSGSGVVFLDHDDDGDLGLYLLSGVYIEGVSDPKGRVFSGATNRLYCNQGDGSFTDCTARSALGDAAWSMAAAVADYEQACIWKISKDRRQRLE